MKNESFSWPPVINDRQWIQISIEIYNVAITTTTGAPDRYLGLCSDYATSWTVRGSSPGAGEIFRTRPDGPWGPPSLLYNGYPICFPVVKRLGCGVD